MATFVRRIVSGPKARHVDKELGVDLDLVYLTDRLIVMGWPGSSIEALYRNNRSTVRKFLDSKHGENYRVFNLCPCWENSYEASEFYGEVGRYPFPDHHPPPLSMIPMFVCDITAWLAANPKNVAVIHCKAGKGRSGTMACSYLLSLPALPFGNNSNDKGFNNDQDVQSPEPEEVVMGNLLAEHPNVKEKMLFTDTKEEERRKRAQIAKNIVGDLNDAYTPQALAERLCAVFEFHSAKRLRSSKSDNLKTSYESNNSSFLREDPFSTSPLRQAKSVSNLVKIASKGFLRSSSNVDQIGSTEHSSTSSPAYTPSRNSASSSQRQSPIVRRKSQLDLRFLGVQPMGKSINDSKEFTATVQGWNSTPQLFDKMVISTTPTTLRENDVNYFSASTSLAPPVFHPGQKVYALPAGSSNHSQVSFGGPSADEIDFNSDSENDDEILSSPIKLAVSIPSQRRFVGYWSRILAGNDARSDTPVRKIRITKIEIDRRIKGEQQDSKSNAGGSLSIHLGRYEPGLEERLRNWETNARRRSRAFGFSDPSAATPEFSSAQSKNTEKHNNHDEDNEDERWRHVERQNSGQEAYDEKLSNQGASFWGINVLAEQERVRNFAWVNSGHDDLLDKVAHMEALKKETEISTFASIREHSREPIEGKVFGIRHIFSCGGNVQDGAPKVPHWLKPESTSSRRLSSSNDTSPSGSSMWVANTKPTPPTSIESASNDGISVGEEGLIVDADNALQIKMLIGRSGASHSHLPDIASCGYVWFIPAFESPSAKCGEKIKRTFVANEIDFRKGKQVSKFLGGEIRRLTVEWEWVDIGEKEWEETENI